MNINHAKLAGLQAFEAGLGRAPALNKDFTTAVFSQAETMAVELLDAYLVGWDIANLAAAAIPGAPSLQSYAEIVKSGAAHAGQSGLTP